jgi:hypothetical protein
MSESHHLICPSCHCAAGLFACDVGQITSRFPRIPRFSRGAFRDRHERWAREAMDALARQTNALEVDGEVVWSGCLDAGINLATMLRIAPGTVTRKPDHRGEHEGNR